MPSVLTCWTYCQSSSLSSTSTPAVGSSRISRRRPVHQGAGEDHTTLHAAGEGPGALVVLVGQREGIEQFFDPLPAFLLPHPEVAAVEVEGLGDRQEPVEVDVLGSEPDRLRAPP